MWGRPMKGDGRRTSNDFRPPILREGLPEIEGSGGGKRMLARLQQYILVNWGTHQVAAQERQSRGGAQPRCALLRVLPSHAVT